MARIIGGPFGLISGKIGNKVYYILNGKQVTRIIGRHTKPPTQRQLANRQGMKVTIDFVKRVSHFINMGFEAEAGRRKIYPQNVAVSYIKKHALKGIYPEIGLDYARVLLSKGRLPGLSDVSVSLEGNAEDGFSLSFEWSVEPMDQQWPICNDQVMLMAYFVEGACFKTDGARRKSGEDVLALPASATGRSAEVYIALVSEDRKDAADSQYLGTVSIQV